MNNTVPISGLNPNDLKWNGGPDACRDSQVDCTSNQICDFVVDQTWGHQCEDCPGTTYSACQSASYENTRSLDDCVDICAVPDFNIRADCDDGAKSAAFTNSFYAVGDFQGCVLYVGGIPDSNGHWSTIYYNRDDRGWILKKFAERPLAGTQVESQILPITDSTKGDLIYYTV